MKVEGCVRIDGGTVEEVRDFLFKFPNVCKVCVKDGMIVVILNYTIG